MYRDKANFFYNIFYGIFWEKIESRGRNENKNKTRNGLNIFYFQLQDTFCVRINEVKYMSLVSIIVVYRHIQWYLAIYQCYRGKKYCPNCSKWYICLMHPRHRQLGVFHKQIPPLTQALLGTPASDKHLAFVSQTSSTCQSVATVGLICHRLIQILSAYIWETKCANIHNF